MNSGYTINDVISAMRQNDWEEGSNPGERLKVVQGHLMDWPQAAVTLRCVIL